MRVLVGIVVLTAAAAFAAVPVNCVAVPATLLQPVARAFPEGLPEGARLAGSRKTAGVLIPRLPEGHRLVLLRGSEQAGEYWLPAPNTRTFARRPAFHLADNGELAVLRTREFYAVYVAGTLTATIDTEHASPVDMTASRGSLVWGVSPRPINRIAFLRGDDLSSQKPDEWPPIVYRSELDGSDRQVLVRLQSKDLEKGDRWPGYHELKPVARSDGKLWLIGAFSGQVMLAEDNGRILRHFSLPEFLKRAEDDPDTRKKQDEEMKQEAENWAARQRTDATKQTRTTELYWGNRSRLFHGVGARGRDLVLVLATVTPPSGSVLIFRDGGEEQPLCLRFGDLIPATSEAAVGVAVTDDAIWFAKPFGFIPWLAVDELLDRAHSNKALR